MWEKDGKYLLSDEEEGENINIKPFIIVIQK